MPIVYLVIVEIQKKSTREPSEILFFNVYPPAENETFASAWNHTKQLDELSAFSGYGNYSVLVYLHSYAPLESQGEWFVVASTLLPDTTGHIHELILRLDFQNFSLVKSYESTSSSNPTTVEDGTKTIQNFIAQDKDHYWVHSSNKAYYYTDDQFLIFFEMPSDLGMTVILNLRTGRIMIAATGIWMGQGKLVYP